MREVNSRERDNSVREASFSNTNDGTRETGGGLSFVNRQENVFGTAGKATDYFVPETYRPFQRETIEEIEAAYEQGYRYVLVDAPTGSGKSHIARAFAFQAGTSHILTVQKILQDQYMRDFPDMFVMKGRNAYSCQMSIGATCAEGPCRLKKSVGCADCPYRMAKIAASESPVTVHNFDSFYYQNSFGMGFGGRKLLIVDECHAVSGKFSEYLSFTITSRGGIEVPRAETIEEYDGFLRASHDEYLQELEALRMFYEAGGLSLESRARMQDLSTLVHRMGWYLSEREKPSPVEYVFDYSTKGRHSPKVTFRPVFVGDFASRWLFGYGERTLLMSATILDKDMYCKEIGLSPEEVYYVEVPSSFPAENRPIIKKYAGKMSYKAIGGTLPVIVEYVQDIADRYPGRKGIVQTHSEKIANYLKEFLDDPRFTFNKDFSSPQEMLEIHELKPGSIIIASGLREGLDLRGDLSKIQVFCKVPYPSLGDKVVARRLEIDPDWYGWITSVMFVQALGRSVRSQNEKAVTYILDSGFGWFYKKNKRFIPGYIRDSIVW